MNYLLSFMVVLEIQVLLAMSLNMVLGYSGMISMSHAAFMGIGAYTAALLAMDFGVNILVGFLLGIIVTALVAVVYGYFTLRIQGDTYILVSFAFQMVIYELMLRWSSLTRGVQGLSGIPRPTVFGFTLDSLPSYFWFVSVITVVVAGGLLYLGKSPFGLAVRGIREGARAMESLGRDTLRLKLINFVIGSAVAGLAGGLFASFLRFTHPGDYSMATSILLLTYVMVGGIGNLWGAIVGAAVLSFAPQALSFLPSVPSSLEGTLQHMLYGVVLIGFIWFRPSGIVPERPLVTVKQTVSANSIRAVAETTS